MARSRTFLTSPEGPALAATERGARLLALLATRFAAIAGVLAATDLRDASSLAAHGAATADAVNALIVFGT
jgi:hypothetical protein